MINQFLILKDIGRGSFAKIKLVLNTENNQKYVNYWGNIEGDEMLEPEVLEVKLDFQGNEKTA